MSIEFIAKRFGIDLEKPDYNFAEVRRILRKSPAQLQRYVLAGKIACVNAGRTRLFSGSDIAEFLLAGTEEFRKRHGIASPTPNRRELNERAERAAAKLGVTIQGGK